MNPIRKYLLLFFAVSASLLFCYDILLPYGALLCIFSIALLFFIEPDHVILTAQNLLFLISRTILLLLPAIFSDVYYYEPIGTRLIQGEIPYSTFQFEYPPLTLIPILLGKVLSLFFGDSDHYRFWFQIPLLVFDLGVYQWLRRRAYPGAVSLTYILLPLLLYPLWYDRLDLVIGLILMMAGISFSEKKTIRAISLIGIATLYKIVPMIATVFAPLFRFKLRPLQRENLVYLVLFTIALLGSALFPKAWIEVFQYHTGRPIQAESLWATLDYLYRTFTDSGDFNNFVVQSHGSFGINPYLNLNLISELTLPILLAALGIFFLRFYKRHPFECFHLLIPFMLFLCFSRVFSPQYLIWIVPLIGVSRFQITKTLDRWVLVLSCLVCGMSSILLIHYLDFTNVRMDLWLLLSVRNIFCLCILVLLFLKLKESLKTAPSSQ